MDSDSDFGYIGGSQSFEEISDWLPVKQQEMEGFRRIPRAVEEDVRFSTSSHPDEGPSNRHLNSSYGSNESLWSKTDQGGSGGPLLEEDRAMLSRKIDELKEQLSRALFDGRVARAPPESYGGVDSWFPSGSYGSEKPPLRFYGSDKHVATAGPSCFSHFQEPFAYPVGNKTTRHGLHPPMHNPNPIPAYEPEMIGRTSHQLHGEYLQQPPHPYQQSSVLHHSSCSCSLCYEKHQRVSAPIPPDTFSNRRFTDTPSNPMYNIENPRTIGSHFNGSRTVTPPPLNVHDTQARARAVLGSGGRRVRPIAGGAPFLTCSNCFELLQMPRKVQLMAKNENKLCCGACSTVINFTVNKRLALHDRAKTKETYVEADDISNEVANDCSSHFHGHVNRASANFSSDDYDHSGYELQSTDQASNSVKSHETQIIHSSSPSISEGGNSPNISIVSREEVDFVQQSTKSILPPPVGSTLQEHFDYSTNNRAVSRFDVVSNKAHTRRNSLNEASLRTEIEVLSLEYTNTEISRDSEEATREDTSKFNHTEEHMKSNVSVNGHELPDLVVKKAEKMAGRIQPGHYWYDFRAGFWGVLGGPCLGIIRPCIEEFNYPMPENCAGGTTGVIVNGRELHPKDLELLSKRGLPSDRDRSYIVEISGKVLDADTGEELRKLGKLAPTVEKAKHGFGMKVRRSAGQ